MPPPSTQTKRRVHEEGAIHSSGQPRKRQQHTETTRHAQHLHQEPGESSWTNSNSWQTPDPLLEDPGQSNNLQQSNNLRQTQDPLPEEAGECSQPQETRKRYTKRKPRAPYPLQQMNLGQVSITQPYRDAHKPPIPATVLLSAFSPEDRAAIRDSANEVFLRLLHTKDYSSKPAVKSYQNHYRSWKVKTTIDNKHAV